MNHFQTALEQFAESFETRTRNDGKEFICLKDDRPDWVSSDRIRDIHQALDDRFPDDWTYSEIAAISDILNSCDPEDSDEAQECVHTIADGRVDVYTMELYRWLTMHLSNGLICDQAREEIGCSEDASLSDRISLGQYYAITRIAEGIISVIEDRANELENEEE